MLAAPQPSAAATLSRVGKYSSASFPRSSLGPGPTTCCAHLPPPPSLPYITAHPSNRSSLALSALPVSHVTSLSARAAHVLTISLSLITMSGSVIISDLETLQNSKNSLAAARNKFFARKIHKLKKVCISSTMITVTYLLDVFKHLSKLEILNLNSKFYVVNTNTV